jgi:chaperonin GroEL
MEEPIRIIVSNAGDEASVVVNAVLASKGNNGYNAATGEYGDLVAQGVIDPTKVTKTALVNAASVAALLLTTDCAICEAPKDESSGGGMPDMSGMGGMGGMGGMM